MRALVIVSAFAALSFMGCDPAGLRRVRVRLPQAPDAAGTLAIYQSDVKEALRVLDTVVVPLGFKTTAEQPSNGYVRAYMLSRPPITVDGRSYPTDVPIRVSKTPTGIEVAFGEFGFLASTPEPAVRAFKDARSAFVSRYGGKNVKTKRFGSANPQDGANGRQPSGSDTDSALARAASRRSP